MGADILDELELMRFTRIGSIRENAILKRAKDEIVQLREDNLRQANAAYADGMARELLDIAPSEPTPAPAMPNGVEDIDWPFTYIVPDSKHEYVPKHHAERKIRDALRAADNRDAAGADGEGWPPCPECKAGILYECTACGSTNYPRDAIAPQPADGEAVAPLGYVRRKAISAMREDDEVTGIMVHVDAPSDSVPVYLHPPAPVQAAPQEGDRRWPFVESPGEFAERLRVALTQFPLIGAVRNVLIENPPALAAHPSACELGARDPSHAWPAADRILIDAYNAGTDGTELNLIEARRKIAALQHRGDSRGGETTP